MVKQPDSDTMAPPASQAFEPVPKPLWWACLACLILGLAVAGFSFAKARQARGQFRAMLESVVEKDHRGASLFRLRIDQDDHRFYRWTPLFVRSLHMPEGPLPGVEDYKVKALAVLDLRKPQRLYFRIRANDAVTVQVGQRRAFDQWRPIPMGIIADFTEDLCAGLTLLEVDYYLGHHKGIMEMRIVDEAGSEVPYHPVKLEVDSRLWQELTLHEGEAGRYLDLGLALALLGLLLPPAWLLVRNHDLPARWLERARGPLPGFFAGFGLCTAWRMAVYLGTPGENDLVELLLIPLLGGLIGALAQKALYLGSDGRPNILGRRFELAKAWYLARENWLAPLAFFAALMLYMSWVVSVRGGSFPDTWLNAPWDALQYKDIMVRGYVMNYTETGGVSGNYPWHPLFPMLARILYWLGLEPSWALVTMAWLGSAAAMLLIFRLARDLFGVSAARWSLAVLVCYPCSFYLLIGYPYGTALALGAAYFLAIKAGRHWLAALMGIGLGMVYPTALLMGLFPIFMIVPRIRAAERPWPEVGRLLLVGAGPALGVLAFCLHHWLYFDNFLLPFTAHAYWGRQSMWPWDTIMDGVLHEPPQYPEAIITILIVACLFIFAHRFHSALWAYLIVVFIAGPATGSLESVYRQYLMAWPLFLLVGSSPRSRWLKAALLWLMVYFALTWYLPLWLIHELV